MPPDDNKIASTLLVLSINDVLFNEWDPLDVGGNINLIDEYHRFAEKLLPAVVRCNRLELEQSLLKFEKELGVKPPPERRKKAAQTLCCLQPPKSVH